MCPEAEPLVIEIGPGKGALTERLLERAERVVAIELDRALVHYLERRFAGNDRLTLISADVLETDLGQWGPAAVAGNLPYYISSPIVEKVLGLGAHCRRAVFLVQEEVAERLATGPGSRDYGYLSVRTQLLSQVELLFSVAPGAFQPPPKVMSAVVRLTPTDKSLELGIADKEKFLAFVARCFHQKRKTIRNNLAGYPGGERATGTRFAGLRAEQMSLGDFAELFGEITRGE